MGRLGRRSPLPKALLGAALLAGCGGEREAESAAATGPVDCASADTTGLSVFVKDPFKRDLAIDTPNRVTEHLDANPALICVRLSSDYGELPPIAYATAHRPDVAYIYPLLVERGAAANDALPVAVYLGKTRALPWLFDHGIDPNTGDALVIAAAENRSRIVDQLLAAGADPNRRSSGGRLAGERGQTALHHAARNRNTGMIESLIGAGASPNVLDLQRRPPLAESVDARHVAGIELLYARGASPSLLPTGELEALRRLARQYGLTQITAAVGR